MNSFDPTKLTVTYTPPVTSFRPVYGRKYFVGLGESTNTCIVHIGQCKEISSLTREKMMKLTGKWIPQMGQLILLVNHFSDHEKKCEQDVLFEEKIKVALQAMVTADRLFFSHFPWLFDSPIYLHMRGEEDNNNRLHYLGTPRIFTFKELTKRERTLII